MDREDVIGRCREKGIDYIINIGSSLENSRRSVNLAKEYDFIYASVGCHPHDADSCDEGVVTELEKLSLADKVIAIGEIGLDYYRNLSSPDNQLKVFTRLVNLAKKRQLPVILHSRQAHEDTLKVLKENMPLRAVVHCFSGGQDFLKKCLDLGFFISFTCNITYKKAQDLREMVKLAPLNNLFLETDAPYLSPEGFRGKRNEPWQVRFLAEEISKIKGISVEVVAQATSNNAMNFFGLKVNR